MTTRHTIYGSELLEKLAECPAEAYPEQVSENASGILTVHGEPISWRRMYAVWHNCRDVKMMPNTIDIDWTVTTED